MKRFFFLAIISILAVVIGGQEKDGISTEIIAVYSPLDFPGPNPGKATAKVQDDQWIISNGALSISWSFSQSKFKAIEVQSPLAPQGLPLTGEVFEVVLIDNTRYIASEMVLDGKPLISELPVQIQSSRAADRIPGCQIEVRLHSTDGKLNITWRTWIHDGGNDVRQEVEITPLAVDLTVREIILFHQVVPGAETAGLTDGSPVVAGQYFLGIEDPMATNSADQNHSVVCRFPHLSILKRGEVLTVTFVVGVSPKGQMRRAFLYYLERQRAHPYRPYLHYNSWYDIAWNPFALNETNCLAAIQICGDRLINNHGVTMDGMVFDDGWDDPKTLWQFHSGFPQGFAPLNEACRHYNTHLGVWLSPFGGYGELKEKRLQFGRQQGYETNDTGFTLAGPKYYAAFKKACVDMIRKYGVNHFKFDGIAAGMYANGGAQYILDTEALRRLMLNLRQESPDLYINFTTGSWPSPFWLFYADSLWRQGGDMGFSGKGPKQQQWLTYRDQETYRNIVRKGPLFPLNSLMTQGIAYSRNGSAGDTTFNSAGLKDDVRAFFGSGTGLQELYIQPDKLTDQDWAILAEAAKWSRSNADVLVDTHWIGGDPGNSEVYGYASWNRNKGAIMLRNPDDQPHSFALDVGRAFELPPDAATRYSLRSPWREDTDKPAWIAESGKPIVIALKPFEVLVLIATPVSKEIPSALDTTTASFRADKASIPSWPDETIDQWNGFKRHQFTVDGCKAWVVEPKTPLPDKPWSWCMEFPDAFIDRCAAPALLAKGFYHAHIVVGNTFGSPTAVEHFNAFYDAVVAQGLAPKVTLIGISRGGLYAYRWASENSGKVSVIYGDAPVCDFKSWPGGKGQGDGSKGDWDALIACYQFKNETEALSYPGNPIDTLKPLAKAGVAIIHVVGDSDTVVPVAENTAILETRYKVLGGEIKVIHKPGIGHHPHGLEDPTPVVDFILSHSIEPPT